MTIFKLPDLGEGLPDAEIVEWHVKVGDIVALDQKLVSMETAKAIVEVPSPFSGKIVKLFGGSQDIIKTGAPLVEFEIEDKQNVSSKSSSGATLSPSDVAPEKSSSNAATVAGKLQVGDMVIDESNTDFSGRKRTSSQTHENFTKSPRISPAIRALAQRLNVNLSNIVPSGPEGMITTQDVEAGAKVFQTNDAREDYEPLRGLRRTMSRMMSQSHAEVVPVTIFEDAILQHWNGKEDITVCIIQAIITAIENEPALNAWFDAKLEGRKIFKEVNLGIAIDTPEGLIVPVLKNAEKLDAKMLRTRVDELKKLAYERHLAPEALKGATITLSNFGKFAGRYANPIVVPPMVAILAVGKLREVLVPNQKAATIATMLPLSLTFDHRAVTGGEATRFLGSIINSLENR